MALTALKQDILVASALLALAGNIQAGVIVFVSSGDPGQEFSDNASVWAGAVDGGVSSGTGVPPPLSLGGDNSGSARAAFSTVNLGAHALSTKGYGEGIARFEDQVTINGPLTIDLFLEASLLFGYTIPPGSDPFDPRASSVGATLSFVMRTPNWSPLDPNTYEQVFIRAAGSQTELGVTSAVYRVDDGEGFTYTTGSFNDQLIQFTFDFSELGPTYDVIVSLSATAECFNFLVDGQCSAVTSAYNSASVRFTGNYVSLGGATYPGLAQGPGGAVPEPAPVTLVGFGILLAGIFKGWARRNPAKTSDGIK